MRSIYPTLLSGILFCLFAAPVSAQVEFVDINLHNGTTISYPMSDVRSITFHSEEHPGDGSEEHPYSVAEALVAYQAQTAAQKVYVHGVIVGSVTSSYYEDAVIGATPCSNSNILIADSRWETSTSRCIPVQLPSGSIRNALSIQLKPENLYHEVIIYGTLDKYFGVAGIKSPTSYTLGGLNGSQPSDTKHPGKMEVPALISGDYFITHSAYVNDNSTERIPNYYISYSPTQRHAHWVAFRFDKQTRQRNTNRTGSEGYPRDPECEASLPGNGFSGTGYDHGHICASADRRYSTLANEQTFYMTNMSPQLPQFNRTYWNYYETYVQNIGGNEEFADTLYVVKGGTIAEGQVSTTVPCNGIQVPVPKYYFIALLKIKDKQYQAMAFWMEHQEYETVSDKTAELSAHAISIDQLEQLTGFDFFPSLPDNIEKTVEASFSPTEWDLLSSSATRNYAPAGPRIK